MQYRRKNLSYLPFLNSLLTLKSLNIQFKMIREYDKI